MTSRDEREVRTAFGERYAIPGSALNDDIERRVIGDAWGANGFTTRAQADEIARRLSLGPGISLLDVGTGRGWPGLYLAAVSGCDVVGTDLPMEGLQIAGARASAEGMDGRASMVVASGRTQPFRPRAFDAIVHSDVIC
ncbi:MAG TPA: methyltransferase domain-containing protein [Acidimicrobiia bacterium]|nr:methyltransferase domain-containing protein [Acidimicrobiia bacterium]